MKSLTEYMFRGGRAGSENNRANNRIFRTLYRKGLKSAVDAKIIDRECIETHQIIAVQATCGLSA
jgi:hypothetical protein